jgi:hypothetical protein
MDKSKAGLIKEAIVKVIGDRAGYYSTQVQDEKIKAIIIVPDEPKSHWKANGLECVIQRSADLNDSGMHGGIKRVRTWKIVLNQWDRADKETLERVKEDISKVFVGRCKISSHQQPSAIDLERCTLLIEQHNYERID